MAMWICLNKAFLSIVQPPNDTKNLLVRARRKGDIEAAFPDAEVKRTPGRDYLYRALIKREEVARVIGEYVMNITASNFKDSVEDQKLHDAYMGVWHIMARLQEVPPYSTGRRGQGALL